MSLVYLILYNFLYIKICEMTCKTIYIDVLKKRDKE